MNNPILIIGDWSVYISEGTVGYDIYLNKTYHKTVNDMTEIFKYIWHDRALQNSTTPLRVVEFSTDAQVVGA
jgi:hypothetical protein